MLFDTTGEVMGFKAGDKVRITENGLCKLGIVVKYLSFGFWLVRVGTEELELGEHSLELFRAPKRGEIWEVKLVTGKLGGAIVLAVSSEGSCVFGNEGTVFWAYPIQYLCTAAPEQMAQFDGE